MRMIDRNVVKLEKGQMSLPFIGEIGTNMTGTPALAFRRTVSPSRLAFGYNSKLNLAPNKFNSRLPGLNLHNNLRLGAYPLVALKH